MHISSSLLSITLFYATFSIPTHPQLLSLPLSPSSRPLTSSPPQPKILFTNVPYTLATEEAERIGVDHIARSSVTGTAQTSAGE